MCGSNIFYFSKTYIGVNVVTIYNGDGDSRDLELIHGSLYGLGGIIERIRSPLLVFGMQRQGECHNGNKNRTHSEHFAINDFEKSIIVQ